MRNSAFTVICFALLTIFGCSNIITTYSGLYEGSPAEGWKGKTKGRYFFCVAQTARKGRFVDYFQFDCVKEGEISIRAFFPKRLLSIRGKEVKVIQHDGNQTLDFTIHSTGTRYHIIRLNELASKDFTVVFPPIYLDGESMPPLSVRFIWSNRLVRVIEK